MVRDVLQILEAFSAFKNGSLYGKAFRSGLSETTQETLSDIPTLGTLNGNESVT